MKRVLISGNDTGIGKTWVLGALARALGGSGAGVQLVKPVETGVRENDTGDAQQVLEGCGLNVSAYRFYAFNQPLAPVRAAALDGVSLSLESIAEQVEALPECAFQLVEGAGGLAVPLEESGADWADLAVRLKVDTVALVVEDRLGAINQARLLECYAKAKGLPAVFVLNQIRAQDTQVVCSNRDAIGALSYPLVSVEQLAAMLLNSVSKK